MRSTIYLVTNGKYLPTADISLGGNRLTLVANATNPGDIINLSQLNELQALNKYIVVEVPAFSNAVLGEFDANAVRVIFHVIGTTSDCFESNFTKSITSVKYAHHCLLGLTYHSYINATLVSNKIHLRFNNTTANDLTVRYRAFLT
jgi:hypothetical protein